MAEAFLIITAAQGKETITDILYYRDWQGSKASGMKKPDDRYLPLYAEKVEDVVNVDMLAGNSYRMLPFASNRSVL